MTASSRNLANRPETNPKLQELSPRFAAKFVLYSKERECKDFGSKASVDADENIQHCDMHVFFNGKSSAETAFTTNDPAAEESTVQ